MSGSYEAESKNELMFQLFLGASLWSILQSSGRARGCYRHGLSEYDNCKLVAEVWKGVTDAHCWMKGSVCKGDSRSTSLEESIHPKDRHQETSHRRTLHGDRMGNDTVSSWAKKNGGSEGVKFSHLNAKSKVKSLVPGLVAPASISSYFGG